MRKQQRLIQRLLQVTEIMVQGGLSETLSETNRLKGTMERAGFALSNQRGILTFLDRDTN